MTAQTIEVEKAVSGIRIAGATPPPAFRFLVEKFPPRDITNKAMHDAYRNLVGALIRELARNPNESAQLGIRMYLNVLTPFITKFEETAWGAELRTKGREVLAFLMEEHSLTQKDLQNEIGTQPYVSDILKGKKKLTAAQIAKLAKRFQVSPSVFFDA